MNCNHLGFQDYDHNIEEWYCRRCGEEIDQPNWSEEEIKEVKAEE